MCVRACVRVVYTDMCWCMCVRACVCMHVFISINSFFRPLDTVSTTCCAEITKAVATSIISSVKNISDMSIDVKVAATMVTAAAQCAFVSLSTSLTNSFQHHSAISPKKARRAEDGWKEVTRT